jgi:hypothetical protein
LAILRESLSRPKAPSVHQFSHGARSPGSHRLRVHRNHGSARRAKQSA